MPQPRAQPLPPALATHRHGYFQALPQREYLPLFWTDEELELLQGTELDGTILEDRSAVAAALLCCGGPLPEQAAASQCIICSERSASGCATQFHWVLRCRQDVVDDYETHVLPFLEHNRAALGRCDLSLARFQAAASWVASRAFYVDEHHGGAKGGGGGQTGGLGGS